MTGGGKAADTKVPTAAGLRGDSRGPAVFLRVRCSDAGSGAEPTPCSGARAPTPFRGL